jgi:hypothetical protein
LNAHSQLNLYSFAKFQSLVAALLGLICGFIYAIGGLFYDLSISLKLISSAHSPGLSVGTILASMAIIGMPIIFAFCGFLLGFIQAWLFNKLNKYIKLSANNFWQ